MLTSSSGILELLSDKDPAVKHFSLQRLVELTDAFWTEISSHLSKIESYFEATTLPPATRKLAALVASKVYYHLGSYDDSVQFALHAVPSFNLHDTNTFTRTIVGKCIDRYVALRQAKEPVPSDLEGFFTELYSTWNANCATQNAQEMLGLALSSRRLDLMQGVLGDHLRRTGSADMLSHCVNIANVLVNDIEFRRDVLRIVANMYRHDLQSIDYFSLVRCLVFLHEPKQVGELITRLVLSEHGNDVLIAMQIALEVFDFSNQDFVSGVTQILTTSCSSDIPDRAKKVVQQILAILSGSVSTELHLKFLYSQSKADIHILNNVKKSIEGKNTVTHNALVLANSIMYCGTTIDGFLRDNLEWLSKASNWAKFSATASVGVIHRGHIKEGMNILEPYLPKGPSTSPYQEAGALFGLGLISAPLGISARASTQNNTDTDIVQYLLSALRQYNGTEQLVHGAALGLGLTAMGLQSEEIFDALFATMSASDAVAGEACALSIGLVLLGSGNTSASSTLLSHAREKDQKEKIIRGISMGIALIMYGREGDATTWAEQLLSDKDHWVRVGGCMTLAMAFAGTGNTKAIERLLQVGVKDVHDDVRRCAIMCIGFITFKEPQTCLDVIKILHDSHNTHIRYGVAMGLGIAAASTGHKPTVELLWQMKADTCDFVRQGAFIALSMVLMQKTEKENARATELRTLLASKIDDKHEDICTKFGCIIATGILDAGGRNSVIALHNGRHNLTKSIVSLFLFTQYWYWFPYTLMISLSLQPTCFIGLSADLTMPKCSLRSDAPPHTFAPPKSVKEDKKEEKREARKVELSTTKKELARQQRRREQSTTFDGDRPPSMAGATSTDDLTGKVKEEENSEKQQQQAAAPASDKADAPTFEILSNPARITLSQSEVVSLEAQCRYRILKTKPVGICMLVDTNTTGDAHDLVDEIVPLTGDDGDEPAPPEPFMWP